MLPDPDFLPALDPRYALQRPGSGLALGHQHPPRILLLYGSLRERSYSRFVVEEAARLLRFFGAEPRIFDPSDLPLPDQVKADDHPAVRALRELSMWSEGQIWCSPERHGQITGVMKAQIDHLPLNMGGMRPTQGRTLAVMQVCAARSPSTPSTRCGSWDGGCGCSPFPISRAFRRRSRNLTTRGG
jgi:arsenic resistance protein ArsH